MIPAAEPSGVLNGLSGPQQSPGFLLWRATLRWQRSIGSALRPLELTHVQFVLLASLWWLSAHGDEADRTPSQREVADQAGTDVMMTSQVVRTLEGRGLLNRTPDPADARVKRLSLTDTGRRRAEQAISIVEVVDTHFFSAVEDQRQLLDVLRQLANQQGRRA